MRAFNLFWVCVCFCLVLAVGCCSGGGSGSPDGDGDGGDGGSGGGDDPGVLTHRSQSDYDVYGYYEDDQLLSTKVVRRGEHPMAESEMGGFAWTETTGAKFSVGGVYYELYYFKRDSDPVKHEWIIGQPVASANISVSTGEFIRATTPAEMTFGGIWSSELQEWEDIYNPSTSSSSAATSSASSAAFASDAARPTATSNDGVPIVIEGTGDESEDN